MLQMVRTLAQFSIALEEMNENGENTGDEGGGGERDGGEEVADRDAVDQFRHNNRNGNSSGNLNGNGLCAGSPNGEVDSCFLFFAVEVRVCVVPVLYLRCLSRTLPPACPCQIRFHSIQLPSIYFFLSCFFSPI